MSDFSNEALTRIPLVSLRDTAYRVVLRGRDPASPLGSLRSAGRCNLAGEPTLYLASEPLTAVGEATRHARDRFHTFRTLLESSSAEDVLAYVDAQLGEYLNSREIYPLDVYIQRVADLRTLPIVGVDEEEFLQEPRETVDPANPQGWDARGYISQELATRVRTSHLEVEAMFVPSAVRVGFAIVIFHDKLHADSYIRPREPLRPVLWRRS